MISNGGSVYLVGAGPGDPELITVRGLRLLQTADVVVHDRLIANALLEECRSDAEIIDVGKYPDHHRISQEEINELIAERGSRGRLVVRLKGGDPFVFGRGQEEVQHCAEKGVPCYVVPGVSSCISGPSIAGVPVTSRGIARSFAVITGMTDPNLGEHSHDYAALAAMDTVVLMMGVRNLKSITAALIENGKAADTPVTCIERATLPEQRVVTGQLCDIDARVKEMGMTSPMVTVIGQVAALADSACVTPTQLEDRQIDDHVDQIDSLKVLS